MQNRRIIDHLLLSRAIYEFYAQGSTYNELHQANQEVRSRWERYIPNTSFKFTVVGYNHGLSQRWQRDVIESFSYMDFLGKIDLREPEIVLGCFEQCAVNPILCISLFLIPRQTKMINALTERITLMAAYIKFILAGWCVLISSLDMCATKNRCTEGCRRDCTHTHQDVRR